MQVFLCLAIDGDKNCLDPILKETEAFLQDLVSNNKLESAVIEDIRVHRKIRGATGKASATLLVWSVPNGFLHGLPEGDVNDG